MFNPAILEAVIDREIADTRFSGVVIVEHGGRPVIREARGYANRSDLIPNTLETRFAIASGCKIFTAVAVCQLVESGALNLESNIGNLLEKPLGRIDSSITVRQLLTHTSGIPDYFDEDENDDFSSIWNEKPVYMLRSPYDFLPLFRDKEMCFSPGSRFKYSNSGFVVLGMVVESVTGRTFQEYVTENVLRKANMVDSGYFQLDKLPLNSALGYMDEPDGTWRSNIYSVPFIGGADGGAFVTAGDMQRFWTALFDHRLLGAEATSYMLTPHAQVNEKTSYGLGVWLGVDRSQGSVNVSATGSPIGQKFFTGQVYRFSVVGGDPGVSFSSAVYPQAEVRTVILANVDDAAHRLAKRIGEIVS